MEGYFGELILFLTGAVLLGLSLSLFTTTTANANIVSQSRMFIQSFSDGIDYLKSAYNGAEYTIVNSNLVACGVRYGLKNFTTELNVPYITVYCPGHVEKTFYHVKLAVNSTGVLDAKYIYLYRVYYDGNLTLYIRT